MEKILILILMLESCFVNPKRAQPVQTTITDCDSTEYDVILQNFIVDYKPSNLNLDSSIKLNIKLEDFLDSSDKACLVKQKRFKEFVLTILIKQYYFQLSEYNQGFDLLQMQSGNAKFIIQYFKEISSIQNIEMLNTGYVLEYLKLHKEMTNDVIKNYEKKISKIPSTK